VAGLGQTAEAGDAHFPHTRRWHQKAIWMVYLFVLSYFILYSQVSDVKYLQIHGNSYEFIAADNDFKQFFSVGPDLFSPRDVSRE